MKFQVQVINHVRTMRIPQRRVKTLATRLLRVFKSNISEKNHGGPMLTLVFVSAAESRRLNRRFRKKDYPTDVLSFSSGEGLGELVICPQVVKKQAPDQGHSFARELEYMIIHGFLHLLGYDHEKSKREELKMFKLQDKLFRDFSK